MVCKSLLSLGWHYKQLPTGMLGVHEGVDGQRKTESVSERKRGRECEIDRETEREK